jgi:uncharacterized membrane protein YvlD (DUF360 family)
MPYTLSHAIVSLPAFRLSKGRLPLAALAVGSVSPDFPYLLALTPAQAPGHSFIGVLVYCLVPSLAVLGVWYLWVERPILSLLGLQARVVSCGVFPILIGVLVGAYSHVIWDATSHASGVFVLGSDFWNTILYGLPIYKWNQYLSGAFGLLGLVAWYLHTLLRERTKSYQGRFTLGLLVHTLSVLVFIVLANWVHGSNNLEEFAVHSSLGVITGGVVGMCIYTLAAIHFGGKSSI